MPVLCKVGSFTESIAGTSGPYVLNGVGFTPTFFFLVPVPAANGSTLGTGTKAIGMCDSSLNQYVTWVGGDTTSDTIRNYTAIGGVVGRRLGSSNAITYTAEVSSFHADGVNLNISLKPTGSSNRYFYVALGGDFLADIVTHVIADSVTPYTLTGVPFVPELCFETQFPALGNIFSSNAIQGGSYFNFFLDNIWQPNTSGVWRRNDTVSGRVSLTALTADGGTFQNNAVTGLPLSLDTAFTFFREGDPQLIRFSSITGIGSQLIPLPYRPEAIFLWSNGRVAADTPATGSALIHNGIASIADGDLNQRVVTNGLRASGAGTSIQRRNVYTSESEIFTTLFGGTIDTQAITSSASLVGLSATEMEWDWTVNDGVAKEIVGFIVGPGSSPPVANIVKRLMLMGVGQ